MNAFEIFSAVEPKLVYSIFDWFREKDRKVYQATVKALAEARKLRLVFIQKKSVKDQYEWLLKCLKSKSGNAVGTQVLQVWLMSAKQDMLATFCDALGIKHDGKGSVEGDLPEELDRSQIDAGVDSLLEKNDPQEVAIYLNLFNQQRAEGWQSIAEKLAEDERLHLQVA